MDENSINERLQAEVAEWKRVAIAQAELHSEAEDRVKQLEDEIEELRKDAERYRWLRDANINKLPYDNHGMGPEFPYDDDLDAIIDNALTTHTLGEPECSHCGGTGDVSGEYPGIACPDCAGTGKAQHK